MLKVMVLLLCGLLEILGLLMLAPEIRRDLDDPRSRYALRLFGLVLLTALIGLAVTFVAAWWLRTH